MLTADLLQTIFAELLAIEEIDVTYDQWLAGIGGSIAGMTDQQIYEALPAAVQAYLGEIGITFSWGHGGIDPT